MLYCLHVGHKQLTQTSVKFTEGLKGSWSRRQGNTGHQASTYEKQRSENSTTEDHYIWAHVRFVVDLCAMIFTNDAVSRLISWSCQRNNNTNHSLQTRYLCTLSGIIVLDQASCKKKNSGPCRKHARTKEYSIGLVENTSLQDPRTSSEVFWYVRVVFEKSGTPRKKISLLLHV